MKKSIFFCLAAAGVILFSVFVKAEEEKQDNSAPLGMEIRQLGATQMLLPVDTHVEKRGGLYVPESAGDYEARKLAEMDVRLKKVEAEQKVIQEKVEKAYIIIDAIASRGNLTADQ